MEDKTSEIIGNICTILGGALLLYPIIEQATKTLVPEIQKITSGDITKSLSLPPSAQDEDEKPKEKEPEHKPKEEEPEPTEREFPSC